MDFDINLPVIHLCIALFILIFHSIVFFNYFNLLLLIYLCNFNMYLLFIFHYLFPHPPNPVQMSYVVLRDSPPFPFLAQKKTKQCIKN